jgi:hypothetical protein
MFLLQDMSEFKILVISEWIHTYSTLQNVNENFFQFDKHNILTIYGRSVHKHQRLNIY